jgi:hypothetical protein
MAEQALHLPDVDPDVGLVEHDPVVGEDPRVGQRGPDEERHAGDGGHRRPAADGERRHFGEPPPRVACGISTTNGRISIARVSGNLG